MSSRPYQWWCDPFWSHFKGRPFDALQGAGDTTLNGAVAADATSIVVASATGFVVGECIAVGSSNTWQTFTLTAIAGTTFTVAPKVQTGGFSNGVNVIHCWNNNAHPASALAYAAYAQTLCDMKMRRAIAATNRIDGVGDMQTTYTDARTVANVPTGWESLGTATFTATSYSTADVLPHARNGNGTRILAAAVGDGMRTLGSIAVTPGESLFVAAMCKHTAGTGFTITVVDKNNTATILGQLTQVMGHRTNFNHLSLAQVHVPFAVPAGVTSVEIRIISTGTTDECVVDDVRVMLDRQASTEDRYLFEDPGNRTFAWTGDSWSDGGASELADQFRSALQARIGRTITWLNASTTGFRLDHMVDRFDADFLPSHPVSLVVEYGANDISQSRSQILMETDMTTMLDKCRRAGVIPIIAGIPPITSFVSDSQLRTDQVRSIVSLETSMSDFRNLTIGAPLPLAWGGTGITSFTLDAATDQAEYIFQAADAITITRLGYRLTTLTGASPTFKISLQGVDASGNPDGTIKGGGSPASKNFTVSGSNSWNWLTLDNSYTCARGEFLAIVISYVSGTIDGSNNVSFGQTISNSVAWATPYTIGNNAGVRTRASGAMIYGYGTTTRAYGRPLQVVRSTIYSSDTASTDEFALRFIFDPNFWSTYSVLGMRFSGTSGAAGKTIKMILYDGTTVLQDMTWDTDVCFAAATTRGHELFFDEATLSTLSAGKEYRISLQPQATATNMQFHGMEFAAAADMDALPGGQQWYSSTRADAGAWTDVLTVRPLAELIVANLSGRAPGIVSAIG